MLNPLLFSLALTAAAPAPCPADTVCIIRDTETYSFRFTYPMVAARVARLDGILREQATDAEARLAEAAAAGGERLSFESHYRLDAALPEIIALSGTSEGWEGARATALLFDPREDERIDLIDLFHPETFDNFFFWSRPRGIRAAQDSFCHALSDAVRGRRAGQQLRELDIACPDVEAQQVTTICNGRGRILALRAFVTPEASRTIDPDAARPYAVDFAMTAEMIGVMKQRYRVAFGLPGETRGRSRRSCPSA